MTTEIPILLFDRLRKAIDNKMALNFPEERWSDLQKKLLPAARDLGFQDLEQFAGYLEQPSLPNSEIEILASYLTVGETYFWREPQSFMALEQKVIPEIIKKRKAEEKRIRIWSAGCSSGEEAYSLAILLKKNIPDIKDWNISIMATDINSDALNKAKTGIYGANSFRNAPRWLTEHYFTKRKGGKLEVLPEIKKMVTVKHLNLAGDVYPSILNNTNAQDIIFCRNVLMYFSKARVREIASKLFHCLVDKGILVVGLSELSQEIFAGFDNISFSGTTFYGRNMGKSFKQRRKPGFEKRPKYLMTEFPLPSIQNNLETKSPVEVKRKEVVNPDPRVSHTIKVTEQDETTDKAMEAATDDFVHAIEDPVIKIRKLADRGELTKAITECEKAINTNKVDPRLRFLLASILQENGESDRAVESLNVAKYLDPKFVLAYYSLANIYVQMGNLKLAKKGYENVLDLLQGYEPDEVIPESEGLTAGRIEEIIRSTIKFRRLS